MGKLSLKEAVDGHRKMWNWIAAETVRQERKVCKNEYFDAKDANLNHDCYCCEYDVQHNREEDELCQNCFIDWGNESYCWSHGVAYDRWMLSISPEDACHYAEEIADLPLKEKFRQQYEQE